MQQLALPLVEDSTPLDMAWDLLPFDYTLNWVYDPEFGWLQFCWISFD